MRRIIDLFIDRPVFASMIILALVVIGGAALKGLGVDRLPSIDMPTVSVRTSLPGASPEEMEMEAAEPLEEAINTVNGIDELRSTSRTGGTFVTATFDLERDIETAAQDIRDRVSQVMHDLPDDATPPSISKFDSDSMPVLTLALSGQRTKRELTEIADKIVKVQLERSPGVGEVDIMGGALRTININVDADRLAAYGLPITAIRDAITRQNTEVPGGNVTGLKSEMSLRTLGRLTSANEFGAMVISTANSGTANSSPIRMSDLATIEDGIAEVRSYARVNGVPTVQLSIRRQSGSNVVEVIEGVKQRLERVKGQLPSGVNLQIVRDQSNYIYQAMHEIEIHLIVGSILACLVVLVFTRSFRSTIITGIAIPVSVISTFGMMWLLDFTLNSVTMLALVLMIGIVIDDAIVVLENIFRHIEEKKMAPLEAARKGTTEIALAVLATTLSLAVIFVPVSFMSSISGRFLFQFGITAAVAVLVSLVISIVLTPTLSGRLLGMEAARAASSHHGAGSRGGFYRYIDVAYTSMLAFVLRHRVMTSVLALGVMASSIPLFSIIQFGYLPQGVDEAEFEVAIEGPQVASPGAMNEVVQQIEKIAMAMQPRVRLVLATVGTGTGGGGGGGQGGMYIRIAPHAERYWSFKRIWKGLLKGHPLDAFRGNYTQLDVMNELRAKTRRFRDRGVQVRIDNVQSFNLSGSSFPIDISISGPELEMLAKYCNELVARGEKIGGLLNLSTTIRLDKPELNVQIDRERAADLGISSRDIGTALSLMVGGAQEVTRYRDPQTNEYYDVRVRLAESYRNDPRKVPSLLLAGTDGRLVELSNIAKLKRTNSPARIERVDRRRDSRVRGSIAPGYSLAERIDALLEQTREMNMLPGYYVSVRGQGREFDRTYREFVFAFILSIVFMYMILASQFENLIHPVTILLSLPLAVPFALLSLWLSGEQLNLYSALGILVLFGVVKKNAILQIDHMNQLRAAGMARHDAMMQGCRDRLRPILMTTLCLVCSMLPLWLGTGPGAEERRAVAVVVIGGQMLSLLLTLLVTPVAYSLLDDLGAAVVKRKSSAGGQP